MRYWYVYFNRFREFCGQRWSIFFMHYHWFVSKLFLKNNVWRIKRQPFTSYLTSFAYCEWNFPCLSCQSKWVTLRCLKSRPCWTSDKLGSLSLTVCSSNKEIIHTDSFHTKTQAQINKWKANVYFHHSFNSFYHCFHTEFLSERYTFFKLKVTFPQAICRRRRYLVRETVTPLLKQLHWLPVDARVEYKVATLACRYFEGTLPDNLSSLLSAYTPECNLRSSNLKLLHKHVSKYKTVGNRAFRSQAPRVWNKLPFSLRSSKSLPSFKTGLKTHLFRKYLC